MSTVDRHAGDAGVSRAALWFGLLGGALAWLAHLMLAYAISEFGCLTEFGRSTHLGLAVVSWLLLAVSLVTLLTAAAATLVAYRGGRNLPRTEGGEGARGRTYVADAGLIASGLFTLVILVESVPIFYYLRGC